MKTECKDKQLEFQGLFSKKIQVSNDGEVISSDGGLVLVQSLEKKFRVIQRLSGCFKDGRMQGAVKHPVFDMLFQRIGGIIQGYEDLNDHDQWRHDILLGTLVGRTPENPLAGKSTLNRLELGHEVSEDYGRRYSKITWDEEKIQELLIDLFVEHFQEAPKEIILDFDATDIPIHGDQDGRFFHGYYDKYCFMPLYCFAGDWPLWVELRSSNIDGALGTVEALQKIVPKIRKRFPKTKIILRADGGYLRDSILSWCELNKIFYIIGMARNKRLSKVIGAQLHQAKIAHEKSGQPERVFTEFTYRTRKSWSRPRRVIAKAEHLSKGSNPRFIVTNLEKGRAKYLYEELYCGRGNMENRIKEQQLGLFADRTSSIWMSANQLRLWFSTFAYVFMILIREGLIGSSGEKYQAWTLRLKLMKVATWVKITSRAIRVRLTASYPYWDLWGVLNKSPLF